MSKNILRLLIHYSTMGRPYAREVDEFEYTYSHALDTSIDTLTDFVGMATRTSLYGVGSGGYFTASVIATTMHEEAGFMAKHVTPLEFINSRIARSASVLVISAGGNNKDILAAFDKAVITEPANLGVLSASVNNRLTKRAESLSRVFLHQGTIPLKKDGFLATNSLIAMSIWLARAYAAATPLRADLPSSLDKLLHPKMSTQDSKTMLEEKMVVLARKSTIVVIYDVLGKAAAVDLESKLVEAGLNNVQLADYRNFAHGRHNWIRKNSNSTGVIFLTNPCCRSLATKTMRLVPSNIPVVEIGTDSSGSAGMLSLLIQVMYAVKVFGDFRGIDPGRLGVAEFGRKIYSIGMPKTKTNVGLEEVVIRRKFGTLINGSLKTHRIELQQFLHRLTKTPLDGIVFDYDGTLCDTPHRQNLPSPETVNVITALVKEIPVGIATGRGRSVRNALREIIPKKFWPNVFVGYYNCANIATLDVDNVPDVDSTTDPALANFISYLIKNNIVHRSAIEERPKQISLIGGSLTAIDLIREIHTLHPQTPNSVKIVESGRSVDILPVDVSKIKILNMIKKDLGHENVLCIGDQGLWPGNDFELLSTPFSLSVDKTSKDPNSCWNLAPLGYIGERAVKYYFSLMSVQNNKIQIKYVPEYLS